MAKSKLVKANEKIQKGVVSGYKKIEGAVVGGYRKIEETVVGDYKKIEDKFVDNFLTKEGESVEDAKERMATAQLEYEVVSQEEMDKRAAEQIAGVDASIEASKNAGKPN